MSSAALHVNGLGGDHGNLRPIYTQFADDSDVVVTHEPLRAYATGRWPSADRHVMHLHWIDHIGNGASAIDGVRLAAQLFAYLVLVRARRSGLVWTMHNATAHEVLHPRLERIVQRGIAELATTIHVPNPATLDLIAARWPDRIRRKARYLPLPDPTAGLPDIDRATARAALHVETDQVLLVAFGAVRPYKGFDRLADAFVGAVRPNLRLVIAGACNDGGLADVLEERLTGDDRAELRLVRQTDEQMAELLVAADWVVLPYVSGENSGVVTTALAIGVPVIVSDLPGLLAPLAAEPDARIVVRNAEGTGALVAALEAAADTSPEAWARASAAASRIHEAENHALTDRWRRLYLD